MLEDAKVGFDEMISACRADFAAVVAEEKAQSTARMDALNGSMADAIDAAITAQIDVAVATNSAMEAANADRKTQFVDIIGTAKDAHVARLVGVLEKITGWFTDKLEWVGQLRDSQYKAHLVAELEAVLASTLADVQDHIDRFEQDYADAL